MRTGSVSGIRPWRTLFLQRSQSWSVALRDAAVPVGKFVGDPSWCGWVGREQIEACGFDGGVLGVNPSERVEPGSVWSAASLVCYTNTNLHLRRQSCSVSCDCVAGNGEGLAESVEGAVFVAGAWASVGVGCGRAHVKCDGNGGGLFADYRSPLFHNGQQVPWSHVVVGWNRSHGNGKESQRPLLSHQQRTLIWSSLTCFAVVSLLKFPTDCLSRSLPP